MANNNDYLKKIIMEFDILLEGKIISKELLLKEYENFISDAVWGDSRNVGIILHTGSICFDAIILILAAVSNWTNNTKTTEEIIESFEIGDTVLYDSKRIIYSGKTEMYGAKYILLETPRIDHGKEVTDKTYVPEKAWGKILPYYGMSTTMDGRGIRVNENKHKEFISLVLSIEKEQVSSYTDTSTVIVMPRERASYLINNLSIRYGKSKTLTLFELVTISYYTENEEYAYGGNVGKLEPNLKITGKVSVARKLITRPEENQIIGFCVLGNEFIRNGNTELIDLINRKSLNYVLISTHIDSSVMEPILQETQNYTLFACTKDFLLYNSLPTLIHSQFTEELSKQINYIIDQEILPIYISSDHTWEEYRQAKRNLAILRTSEVLGDNKDDFIVEAHALMKLFLTATFPISHMDNMIANKVIDIKSPLERLMHISEIANKFPDIMKNHALSVIELLMRFYKELYEENEKEKCIQTILASGDYKKVAIVVPKIYYRDVLMNRSLIMENQNNCDITITTANRFDNSVLYDCIITTGMFDGRKFNVFKCKSSPKIIPIIYDFESNLYQYNENQAIIIERKYNEKSFKSIEFEDHNELDINEAQNNEIAITFEEDKEMDKYVKKINEIALINSIGQHHSNNGNILAEIVLIARFENGQVAYFSKYYTPYVYDSISQSVTESTLKDLAPGDGIIFTQNNDETKDIVEAILSDLVTSDVLDKEKQEAYRKSKHWKQVLRNYMDRTGATYNSISILFEKQNVSKGAATIRNWISPDSHIVGPIDFESYYAVAKITEDDDMLNNPKSYCDACATVRKIRREILKQIDYAILSNISGKKESDDSLFELVYERIDKLAQILRIKSLVEVENQTMPFLLANKPLNI